MLILSSCTSDEDLAIDNNGINKFSKNISDLQKSKTISYKKTSSSIKGKSLSDTFKLKGKSKSLKNQ